MKNDITKHNLYKKLLKEFHPTKNGDFKLSDFSSGSEKKVHWKCFVVYDHEWESSINKRTNREGCPCCSGRKVVSSNCLATTNPELAEQWHPIKNKNSTPHNVTAGSRKKVWWKCSIAGDHEWEASINNRKNGCGCPCCSGYKAVKSNCLATTHPKLTVQWHPTKNKDLTPHNVTAGSNKKVHWKCSTADDHEWEALINKRTSGKNCPCCAGKKVVLSNCLATINPKVATQWHPTKNNNLTSYNVTSGSKKIAYWQCESKSNHTWSAIIASRTRINGNGCPHCNESKGEKSIKKFLIDNKIIFESEKRFNECKNKKPLPFDFYLTDYNLLIEYDGIFHYEPIEFVGGIKKLKETQMRDKIKTKYAKDNNIHLLRIPYTEFDNIENIISTYLSNN